MRTFRKQPEGVAGRASAGATFLDQQRPGWHRQIDTGTLNIARSDRCALGQLYGSYVRGITLLEAASQSVNLGFSANASGGSSIDEYNELTEAWRREIEVRLDAERARWAQEQEPVVFRSFRKTLART